MSKTIRFQFAVGGVLTDINSITLSDPTGTFGIRRTDTGAVIAAASTPMTHLSAGLYSFTFDEPQPGLDYEYWLTYTYNGNTRRLRQILETSTSAGHVSLAPLAYREMGITAVALGDSTLTTFLTNQADLVWAMQARRGVALNLHYQYYVSDLIVLAMDHVRMLIDTETGDSAMHDRAAMDATNISSADSSTSKKRSSSFTESSASSQNWVRTASRTNSASSILSTSNSASRDASQSDHSTMSQSSSGSSSRTQTGSSSVIGSLSDPNTHIIDGATVGKSESKTRASSISQTKYEGGYLDGSGMPPGLVSKFRGSSFSASLSGGGAGIGGGLNWSQGDSASFHQVTPSTLGRINPSGGNDSEGASGDYSLQNSSTIEHGRSLIGSQIGTGSSTYTMSGTRANNRAGSMTASSSSSVAGHSASSMSSSSHEEQARNASSSSHSESTYHSTMTASASSHREGVGSDAMTASGNMDREYWSQIFDSLKTMFDETQEVIRDLEQTVMMTSRYLMQKLGVVTPQAKLVAAVSLPTLPTLTQTPGISGVRPVSKPWDRFIVR